MSNAEVIGLLRILGYDQNKPTLRVGKIILFSDADVDGKHINMLILSFLQRFVPFAIEKGMVYVVDSPLFTVQHKGKTIYGKTLKDLKEKVPASLHEHISRIKGWGEVDSDQLRPVAFDSNRVLRQIKPLKKVEETHYLSIVGGSEASSRREVIGIKER